MRGLRTDDSLVLTKFKKLPEFDVNPDQSNTNSSSKVSKKEDISSEKRSPRKLTRSLTFSSILPSMGNKKGKLKISKFEGDKKLKSVEENSELTSFCDSLKRNTTFKDRVLKTHTVTDINMRRLSLVCDEIDKFEREFVEPVRISASSVSLAATLDRAPRLRNSLKKHHSATLLDPPSSSRLDEMNKYFSSDSVASGYDSGAFSRESTPDLSLASSLDTPPCGATPITTEDCENNIVSQTSLSRTEEDGDDRSHCDPQEDAPRNFLSSTPRKPLPRSQSERLPQRQVASVRRSHTTVYGDLENFQIPATVSRASCSQDCRSRVTVNGFCYH